MSSRRSWKKFLNTFFVLFLIYLVIVPVIFFMLDFESAAKEANKALSSFILKTSGIALLISYVIALWLRKDPALRRG